MNYNYGDKPKTQVKHPTCLHAQPNPQVIFPILRGGISTHCGRCGKEARSGTVRLFEKPIDLGYKFCGHCAVAFYHFLRGEPIEAIDTTMPYGEYVGPYLTESESDDD